MDDLAEADSIEPSKKRLRTSHACDVCRSRKIRCDGNKPCHACLNSKQECSYGSEANTRGKSDLILEGVLRVEELLQQMNLTLVQSPTNAIQSLQSPISARPLSQRSLSIDHVRPARQTNNLENAILDSLHTSTTESILSWSYFDAFPSIRQNYTSIFQLEQSRPSLLMRTNSMYPYLSPVDLDAILNSFQGAVNFWYPILSLSQLENTRSLVAQGLLESTDLVGSCCAQLIMALGCAGEVVRGLVYSEDTITNREEVEFRRARKAMGDLYFDGALRAMHMVHSEMSCMAVQSVFFAALYFAYLRRPLQAWNYIHSTASKCLLLLSYPPVNEPTENQECLRRIFWACYILESDYLAELSALPQSGIAQIESSVPLPGTYITHADPEQTEHASLYFLACISMRRLLNRVHHLLYARDSGAATDITRFPAIVTELDHQLDEWRDVLPHAFRFDAYNISELPSECGGFLRQRYLTCKSVIYRPYLAWMLANSHYDGRGISKDDLIDRAHICLDACTSHILALTGFAHTVLVDTWICALSMATAMMILLATGRSTSQITHRYDITETGPHLRKVFRRWQETLGAPESPSVEQALRIICETERLMSGLTGSAKVTEEDVDAAASMCAMTGN
ncbi:putative C6 zinc finger domain-containing protein [Seiridium cardinale]|uniref:C6 zinc finger domain-containing protein n=1 Tax=Seiridium cardinale TaxID=138064 RepID=A0ABR2XR07_9PEZI